MNRRFWQQLLLSKNVCELPTKDFLVYGLMLSMHLALLKERFPSLKGLGMHCDIQDTYWVIEALMTIHNMCIDFNNAPQYIPNFDTTDMFTNIKPKTLEDLEIIGERVDGNSAIPAHETEAWLLDKGCEIRAVIMNELIPEIV